MSRSPQNIEDGGGWGSRATLSQYPSAKTVYFYKDGDQNFNALKLAIHPRKYRSFETLLNELSTRIPLSFGVRSIFTPRGHDPVGNLDGLLNEGRYVCSTHPNHAKGVDLNRFGPPPTWHCSRPPSGRRALNTMFSPRERDRRNRIRARRRMDVQRIRPAEASYNVTHGPKKITVMKNGEPNERHIVLLNRRTAQTFEQVLADLSDMFKMAARKIYTIDGRRIQSLSSLFNGPDVFVVAGAENFRLMIGFSPQPPLAARPRPNGYRSRMLNNPDRSFANRLRDRRERLGKTRGRWRVWVTTNELPSAGTDAGVSITVYGTRSNSGPIALGYSDGTEHYQSGKIDQFDINIGSIGEVYKIRIAHDNIGEFPNWLCDEVKMKDMDTDEELVFKCRRWLARDEEDGEICREIPAVRKGDPVLPVVQYEVTVSTGDLWNAGTKANVYLTMYGERGDTGIRHLTAERKDLLFLAGQTNTFHVEAVSLGPIKRLIVGHDTSEAGDGWFLDKIVVKDPTKSHSEFTFYNGKWLDGGQDDGKIVRELRIQDEYMVDLLEKKYWDYEKWKFGHKNQISLISIQTGKPLRIKADATVDAASDTIFKSAVFTVMAKRGMTRVFSSVLRPNFHLAIDNGRVLGQGKGGAFCEFRVRVQQDRTVQLESVKYPLQHVTIMENGKPGDVRGMTVDKSKQFYVYCKGMFRDTGVMTLMTSPTQSLSVDHENEVTGAGKKSRVSQFRVHKVSEGGVRMFESVVSPGQYLQLKQGKIDCQGDTEVNSHFIVEKHKDLGYVCLQSAAVKGLYIGMAADGSVKPTVNTGGKNVWLYPEVIEFGTPKVRDEDEIDAPPSPVPVSHRTPSPAQQTQRSARSKSPDVVVVQQTHASPRKASPPPEESPKPSPEPEKKPDSAKSNKSNKSDKSIYEAGDWKAAISTQETAQNCDIALVAYGDQGNSGQIILGSASKDLFQKGNMDDFKVNLLSVGVIYKIRLELILHEINADAFWKVKEVKLQDGNTKELLKFSFDRWLSLQQDDGEVMRELPALRPGQPELPVMRYQVLVHTGSEVGADTDAHLYVTLHGERSDTGKRLLHRSNKDQNFRREQVDEFWIEAVSLGKLKSCQVSHDGQGAGEGWYCNQVVVREGPNATTETVFPCNQWFDSSMADKKIERVLTANEESAILMEDPIPVVDVVEEEPIPPIEEAQVVETASENHEPEIEEEKATEIEQEPETGQIEEQPDTPVVDNDTELTDVVEEEPIPQIEEAQVLETASEKHEPEIEEKATEIEQEPKTGQIEEQPDTPVINNETDPDERPVPVETVQEETQEEKFKAGDWKIWVTTGKDDSMKITDDIILVAYGEEGISDPITLGSGKEGIFQPANTDEFMINLGENVGNLYKIRIGHKNMNPENGWFLEKVKMQDMTSKEVLTFKGGRWLSRGQDDLDTWRELPVVRPGTNPLPVIVYHIEAYTGSAPGAETDANVYLTLYGSHGDSGQRVLYRSQNNDNKFQSGQTDVFNLEAVSLDNVTKVVIGHDGKGAGAGWFLDKLVVKETTDNQTSEYYFPCNRWLDEGQDDALIEREILVQEPPADSRGEYRLSIKTLPDSKPANQGKVYITAYGEKGRSKEIEVVAAGNNGKTFEPGNVDDFDIIFGDLGDLYKIRVTREDNSNWEGWHLKEVKLSDKATEKEYLFSVDRWLARNKEDFDITRELPVMVENKPVLPVRQYEVQVYTGNRWAAATGASAYITLYGQKGDSGKRVLFHSTNNEEMLKQNQVDSFLLEAVSLEELSHLVIGHNGKGHGSGWFVDKVVIIEKDGERAKVQQTFPCGQWLDDHEGDGKTERTLRLLDSVDPSKPAPAKDANKKTQGKWKVTVKTSDIHNAGTHAQVYLIVYGTRGTSKPQPLGEGNTDSDLFDQGKLSEFNIDVGEIGELLKVRLEQDNKNNFPAWHVDYLKLSDADTQEEITLYIDRWMAIDEEDGQLCREFPISTANQISLPVLHYIVAVYTGSLKEAGTDTTIYFNLFGDHGDIGHRPLMDSRTNAEPYQPGQVDVFVIEAVSVGKIEKVELFHNGKNRGQSWFVEKVVVLESEAALTETVFHCSDWLEVKDGETMAMKQFKVTDTPPASHSVGGHLDQSSNGQWSVWMTTGSQKDSGTKDNVFMVVYGTLGYTEPKLINESGELTPGSLTQLKISTGVIGRIFKVRLFFEGKEKEPTWFLKKMKMKDDDTGQEFHFDFNDWLKSSIDNPSGVTELAAIRPDIPPLSETKYIVSVLTGTQHCADTQAGVFCNLIGQWGESGQRPLATPRKSSDPFKKGQVDEFAITSLDLGQIDKLVIGHKKGGRGQGWFCEKVTVKTLSSPTEQVFICNRWLDTGCEDRKLTTELFPLATIPIQAEVDDNSQREKSKGVWSCLVTMASASKLSHHTINEKQLIELSLTVCGDKSTSEMFQLNKRHALTIGQMEKFRNLQFGDIGKIEKIRVDIKIQNNVDSNTLWVLDEIILEDEETKESLRFDFSSFVGKVYPDSCKELPAVRPTETVKPVIPYNVKVYTISSDKDATSTSPIFITMYGKEGNSGRRLLAVNQQKSKPFQTGQIDDFEVEAVSLGQLESLLVTKEHGDPWHLDKVVVKEGTYAGSKAVFRQQNAWLAQENEKEVAAVLMLAGSDTGVVAVPKDNVPDLPDSKGSWNIQTVTGKNHKKVAGLNVVVVLCGDRGETDPLPLTTTKKDMFAPGKLDDFKVKLSPEIGDLFKVRIGFADRTKDKKWTVDKLSFHDEDTADQFSYELESLQVDSSTDGWREFPVIWPAVPILPVLRYSVSVHVGEVHKLPPNINVTIQMDGERGSTGVRQLKKTKRFQKEQVDVYEIEAVTLMNITKVTLNHDGKAAGTGFFIKKVVIKESPEAEKEFVFECEKWFDAGEDDKQINRVLLLGNPNITPVEPKQVPEEPKQVPEEPKQVTEEPKQDAVDAKPKTPIEEKAEEPVPLKPEEPEKDNKKETEYYVEVDTGDSFLSGTDANVYITVYGENGDTGKQQLKKSEEGGDMFESGKIDTFIIKAVDLGKLTRVVIGHDGSEKGSGWKLDNVMVREGENADDKTIFHCGLWLDADSGDKKIEREIFPIQDDDDHDTV